MAWQYVRIARFGGPEVLELAEHPTTPHPGPGEVRIKVLAAGTGFTDTFIRRGRYPDWLWDVLSGLFGGRHAVFYSITSRRSAHPEEFRADMVTLFDLLRDRAIHPVVIDRLPLAAAREVHTRIDLGGLGGKIVLLPWAEA